MGVAMPSFFLPFADSPEQAERLYVVLQGQNPYPANPGRLFQIVFRDHSRIVTAQVGKDLLLWAEPISPVLAIIETNTLLTIHTQLRGGLSATPILVSSRKVTERVYFDDFPAHS